MNPYLRLLVLLMLVAQGAGLMGQVTFREGQVITTRGDTLNGLIKDGYTPRNSWVCLFKENKKAEVVAYSPEELRSFKIAGEKYYAAQDVFIKGEPVRMFTRVLLEGDLNLYHQRKNRDMAYYLETEDGNLLGLVNKEKKFRRESNFSYAAMNHYEDAKIREYKDTLIYLFRDSEKVQNQVLYAKYDDQSLLDLTRTYVKEKCPGDDCISYEIDLSKNRDRFGWFTGVYMSKIFFEENGGESEINTTVPIAVFYHIPLAFIHDRLSFQNEVIYTKLRYNQIYNFPNEKVYSKLEWQEIGIPFLLHYKISANDITPTIGFGKEFGFVFGADIVATSEDRIFEKPVTTNEFVFNSQKGGWFVDLGMDYKINSKISLFSNIRLQHHKNKIIPDKYENLFTFKVAQGTVIETYSAALHIGLRF